MTEFVLLLIIVWFVGFIIGIEVCCAYLEDD